MKMIPLANLPDVPPKDNAAAIPAGEKPVYPYGTCLYLEEDTLAALGMKSLPTVGTEIPIEALAKVVGTSEREYEGGTRKCLDLQITSMALGSAEETAETMKKLYPSAQG